ncbi:MAG: hypothetical protein KGL39_01385 [Patescibacteria group bacterium]|nr:hypothetical protein [Patescibacteria group bacterium]
MARFKIVDCRLCGYGGFPYAVGKLAETKEEPGLHSCARALDCYAGVDHLTRPLRFLVVEVSGAVTTDKMFKDTTISTKITPSKEMKQGDWMATAFAEVKTKTDAVKFACLAAGLGEVAWLKKVPFEAKMELLEAAKYGRAEVVRVILEAREHDFATVHTYGPTALYLAALGGFVPLMEYLYAYIGKYGGITPAEAERVLLGAAASGIIGALELAIKWGAKDLGKARYTAELHGRNAVVKKIDSANPPPAHEETI